MAVSASFYSASKFCKPVATRGPIGEPQQFEPIMRETLYAARPPKDRAILPHRQTPPAQPAKAQHFLRTPRMEASPRRLVTLLVLASM